MHSTTYTLPPLSELLSNNDHSIMNNVNNNASSCAKISRLSVLDISNLLESPPTNIHSSMSSYEKHRNLKGKRKRASPNQLRVLNHIFNQTYFPSTEVRIKLGKQLGMSPRTVQIWFQNKRQALRSRGNHTPTTPPASFCLPPISPPRSPYSIDTRLHHSSQNQPNFLLPPLNIAIQKQHQHYSPPSLSYPSPHSFDQLHYRDY